MKNFRLDIVIPCLFLLCTCAKPPLSTSQISGDIAIDGNLNEWKDTFFYDKPTRLLYSISNDDKNLYLALKVKDEKLERKIMATGLTVWIDTTGKFKERIAVKFPLGEKDKKKNGHNIAASDDRKDKKEMRAEFLKTNNQLEVKGFAILKDYGDEFYRTSSQSKTGINASLGYDTINTLNYEMEIPLSWLYPEGAKINGKVMGIRFLSGSVDMMDRNNGLGPSAVDRTQGGLSGNGMGGRGRPTGDPRVLQEMQYMSETTEVRVKVALR